MPGGDMRFKNMWRGGQRQRFDLVLPAASGFVGSAAGIPNESFFPRRGDRNEGVALIQTKLNHLPQGSRGVEDHTISWDEWRCGRAVPQTLTT